MKKKTKEGFGMEQQLREHLMEGEQLLWSGRPEAFETLDKTNKSSIITGLVIKLLVTIGLLVVYVISARDNSVPIKPGVIIAILALAAVALANPFLIARRLRRKTVYGLTDKRVLRSGVFDQAIPYERIRSAELRTDEDGHTSLLCGPRSAGLKPRKWRGEAEASFIDNRDEPEAARVIFYAIPVSEEVKGLLKQYLPIK